MKNLNPTEAQLAANLRLLLAHAGLTQAALAEELGVTRSLVTAWVGGRSCPLLVQLLGIARLFRLSIETLATTALTEETAMSSYPCKTANKPPTIEVAGTPKKRIMRDLSPPSEAELRDCAPVESYAPPVPPRALGSGAYSGAVVGVFGLAGTQRLVRS